MITVDAYYIGAVIVGLFVLAIVVLGICCEVSEDGIPFILAFLAILLLLCFAIGQYSGSVYHPVGPTTEKKLIDGK